LIISSKANPQLMRRLSEKASVRYIVGIAGSHAHHQVFSGKRIEDGRGDPAERDPAAIKRDEQNGLLRATIVHNTRDAD
jgi:hypothetical protein